MDVVHHWYGTQTWIDELEDFAMNKFGSTYVNHVDAYDLPPPKEILFEGVRRVVRNIQLLEDSGELPSEILILILRETHEWAERWAMLSDDGERFAKLAARIEKDFKQLKKGRVPT